MLADADKRARYDRFGHAAVSGAGGQGFDPSVFTGLRGHPRRPRRHLRFRRRVRRRGRRRGGDPQRGADLRYDLEITFAQSAKGAESTMQIPRHETCDDLQRHAARRRAPSRRRAASAAAPARSASSRASSPWPARAAPVAAPDGSSSSPCKTCRGEGQVEQQKKLTVKIPAGIASGQRLRLTGEGEGGMRGGPPGDLYVVIFVQDDARFTRDGNDLHCEIDVWFTTLALGGEVPAPGHRRHATR